MNEKGQGVSECLLLMCGALIVTILMLGMLQAIVDVNSNRSTQENIVSSYCSNYEYVSDNIYKCDGKLLSCTDTSCNVFLPDKKIKETKVVITEEEV